MRPRTSPRRGGPRRSLLSFTPGLTLAVMLGPIALGLAGTVLPAFGYFPALGFDVLGLEAWRAFLAWPGLTSALGVSLLSGLGSCVISVLLVVLIFAACGRGVVFTWFRRLLGPILALPHAALAIGFAFLIAPSGWLARGVSPWLTGWDLPPEIATVQDSTGLALMAGLVVKETPFLFLMALAAESQAGLGRHARAARTLGYAPMAAWLAVVFPQVYFRLRLPVFAVLAYALSNVDMAQILGPTSPPSLAVMVLKGFQDPDLDKHLSAAAGALAVALLVAGCLGVWVAVEKLCRGLLRAGLLSLLRQVTGRIAAPLSQGLAVALVAVTAASLGAIVLWAFTQRWRYPAALPDAFALQTWARQSDGLITSTWQTLVIAIGASGMALVLVLACLEWEQIRPGRRTALADLPKSEALIYLPLLVPQVAFLFGIEVLATRLGWSGTLPAVIWAHLIFVLPYIYLSLVGPYRGFDPRYRWVAKSLGAGPGRILGLVIFSLLPAIVTALAVGFAVSVTQYLPTLALGAGRVQSLTSEAVALASGGDRRVVAVYALCQGLLPFLGFALALGVPRLLGRWGLR